MQNSFLDALARAGIPATHSLVFDGKLRRYNVAGDKKGRRNGWYRLTIIRPDFAWGVFGCNKRGITQKFNSAESGKITNYDKGLIRKRQAEIKKEEESLQGKVSLKANTIWNRLKKPAFNGYAEKKGVGVYNAKEMGKALVVPVYEDHHIVSLQFITDEGDKRFLTGGKIKGCNGFIGAGITPRIWICEGYATAATIFEATGDMVAIGFFASNLPPVAATIRENHPQAEIIIAADNDQFGGGNAGLSYARQAAEKIGAKVVYPDFPANDKQKNTDFNDWRKIHGLESTRDELLGVKKQKQIAVIEDSNLWKTRLIEGKEFKPGYPMFDGKSRDNTYAFMVNHENFRDLLAYNDFTGQTIFLNCPPWEDKNSFFPREVLDYDAPMWVNYLERLGIRTNKDAVFDFIIHIAKKKIINPPADYFNSLVWDGVARLDRWLPYYLGAEKQDAEYLRLVGSKWILSIVARIFSPGIKADNVLILEGTQGIQKTAALEALATFNGENFFLEFTGDITAKDSFELFQGKVIVEMSELATVKKSEVEDMKALISRRIDEYRPPYGRAKIKRPRYFIFGGSTNQVGQEYLEDETGARRIWPVECGNNIDLDSLRRDQPQLYAEAIVRYKQGEKHWLVGDEVLLAKGEQSDRQSQDIWEEKVSSYLNSSLVINPLISEIGLGIGLNTKDLNNYNTKRIKRCLKSLGWEEFKEDTYEGRIRKWKKI